MQVVSLQCLTVEFWLQWNPNFGTGQVTFSGFISYIRERASVFRSFQGNFALFMKIVIRKYIHLVI